MACCGGSHAEVEKCIGGIKTNEYTTCYLHPYRFGTDPFNQISEAKKEQGRKLAERNRERSENNSSINSNVG